MKPLPPRCHKNSTPRNGANLSEFQIETHQKPGRRTSRPSPAFVVTMVTVIPLAATDPPYALLAAASTPASFNAGFDATAAAVIPVLYLALTVQGSMLPGLLTRMHKALGTTRRPEPGE